MKDGRTSATAMLIARSQVLLAETQAWAVDPDYLSHYQRFVEGGGIMRRAFLQSTEHFGVPGLYLHFALRKKLIESIVQGVLANGVVRQVVVIAAGLDPLAAVLHQSHPATAFFEIDLSVTQAKKKSPLTDAGSNLFFCPADLTRTSIAEALAGSGFSPALPTIFIAEGITMYLDAKQVDKFFAGVRAAAQHPDSSLLFTYMARSPLGVIGFDSMTWMAKLWLQLMGEPMKWGVEPDAVPAFLAARGFTLKRDHTAADLSARYVPAKSLSAAKPPRLAKGENICWAGILPDWN